MLDCIFCKIVQKQLSAHIIYEDELILAFLDAFPQAKGHVLIIPKTHYETLLNMPDDILAKIGVISKKIANVLVESLNVKDFKVRQNNGKIAGQVVPHYHIHVIPMKEEISPIKYKYSEEEARQLAEQLRLACNNNLK